MTFGNDYQKTLTSDVYASRPYFRVVVCNHHAVSKDPSLAAGKLMILTNGEELAVLPEPLVGTEAVCVDYRSTLIAKTTRPSELIHDALQQVAEEDVRRLPHWEDSLSITLLDSTTALLALNVVCKPARFAANTFFFAYDYLDEVVAQAFNDRTLRARWRKAPRPSKFLKEASDE